MLRTPCALSISGTKSSCFPLPSSTDFKMVSAENTSLTLLIFGTITPSKFPVTADSRSFFINSSSEFTLRYTLRCTSGKALTISDASFRAVAFSAAGTESSKSIITTSAALEMAFTIFFSTFPGTNNHDLILFLRVVSYRISSLLLRMNPNP